MKDKTSAVTTKVDLPAGNIFELIIISATEKSTFSNSSKPIKLDPKIRHKT